MTRHTSPPAVRPVLFVIAIAFAMAAAMLGGGSFRQAATAAEGDGSFVLCKQYWATGPSIKASIIRFDFMVEFEVEGDENPEPFGLSLEMIESGEGCSDPIFIPAGAAVTVTETLPDGWVNTPTYPRSVFTVGGVDGPLQTDSTVATFDGSRCVEAACVLTFKNKQDETGEGIVPPLADPFRGTVRVCKAFEDNGDDVAIGPTQFTFEWTDKFRSFAFPIGPFIPEGVTGCSGFSVIDVYPGDTLVLRELPNEEFPMANGFPTVELEGPSGFAARPGTRVILEMTTCSEEELASGGVGAALIEGEGTFECTVTFTNRAVAEGVEAPCGECSEPEPDPVEEEPNPEPEQPEPPVVVEPPVFVEPPVVVEPEPTEAPSPEPTVPSGDVPVEPTPELPVAAPEPVETVAGEVTPGPQPTPLAPDTGTGVAKSDGGRAAISLGLAALSAAFFVGGMSLRRRE